MNYSRLVARWFKARFRFSIALLALWLLIPVRGIAQVTFGNPTNYPVGSGPGAIAAGDFNGDGHLDLAVVNAGSNDVSILLGNGDGTFQAAINYAVGQNPTSIVVVDLNLDRKMDLIVALSGDPSSHLTGGISVLLGNGNGTFQPATTLALDAYPSQLDTGDFNGDHKPDLALTNGDATVGVLLGNGDGTFQAPVNYVVTTRPASGVTAVFVGDFNGDKKLDLLATTFYVKASEEYGGGSSVLMGRGDGTFQAPIEEEFGGAVWSGAVGDFNGDHKLDIAFITKQNVFTIPYIAVLLGSGDGTFGTFEGGGSQVDANNFDSFVTVADLNADGLQDVLGLSFPVVPAGRVFLSQGNGTFELDQTIVFGGFGPRAAAVGDFNGDLLPDLAITMGGQDSVNILLNMTVDFALGPSALTPATVSQGQSATSTLATSAANGFSGTISFTCAVSPLPQRAPQCSISPSAVSAGSPATLTITTTAPQVGIAYPSRHSSLVFALWLPACGLTFLGTALKRQRTNTSLLRRVSCLILFTGLLALLSCGGSGNSNDGGHRDIPGTPAGAYIITVTGTSGSTHHSTPLTIKVQ